MNAAELYAIHLLLCLASAAEFARLQRRIADLEDDVKAARQTVGYEQDRQRTHALTCRRPAGGWPPITAVDDVPTGTAL